jgi:hypothetical protein
MLQQCLLKILIKYEIELCVVLINQYQILLNHHNYENAIAE